MLQNNFFFQFFIDLQCLPPGRNTSCVYWCGEIAGFRWIEVDRKFNGCPSRLGGGAIHRQHLTNRQEMAKLVPIDFNQSGRAMCSATQSAMRFHIRNETFDIFGNYSQLCPTGKSAW